MENRKPKIRERIGLKIFAVIMATILFGACFFSGVLTVICLQNNVYIDGGEQFLETAAYDAANRRALTFSHLLSRIAPLHVENGVLDITDIDIAMDGIKQDDCNYIIVMKDGSGNQLYTTGNAGNSHAVGYKRIIEGYYQRVSAVDPTEREQFSGEFTYINAALDEMNEQVISYGFVGTLYAVVTNVRSDGTKEDSSHVIATADELGTVQITDDFKTYAELCEYINDYRNVFGKLVEDEQQPDGFDWEHLIYKFDVIDPYDGEFYPLYIDVCGRANYRDEIIDPTLLPSLLEHMEPSEQERFEYYLDSDRAVGLYFLLEGTYDRYGYLDYYLDVYVDKTPEFIDSAYFAGLAVGVISSYAKFYPIVLIASGVLLLIFVIFICCVAGYRLGEELPKPIWFDKIPFELFAVANFLAMFWLLFADYRAFVYHDVITDFVNYRMLELAVMFAYPFCAGLLAVLTVMTLATRLKSRCFWRYTAVGMVFWIVVKVFRFIGYILRNIRLTWKVVLLCAGVFCLDVFALVMVYSYYQEYLGIFIWFTVHVMLSLLLLMWAGGFSRIRDYAKKIANGELGTKIDRNYLFGDLRHTADDLEGVGEGVRRAVDERMRSERLKTELITNVSHDLKTPLTSIVNYVDILSKDDIQDESAREHIDVLKRQAARMKKLIEDLVEVSKASSGNVSVNLERTDVNLLLTQTLTEYSQKFADGKLMPVVKIPEQKMIANLDGRLMWRVLDNLCNNICKYALAGTRVYITAEDRAETVTVTFKNISRFPLDISGEDLMERFVRGDSSRNTEGSGLGLSIAKSLCDLQGVGFGLAVDGDLFKAELTIQKATDDELLDEEPIVYDAPLDIREAREHVTVLDEDEETTTETVNIPASEDIDESAMTPPEEPSAGEISEEE